MRKMKTSQTHIGCIGLIISFTFGILVLASAGDQINYEALKVELLSAKSEMPPGRIDTQLNALLVAAVDKNDASTLYQLLSGRHYGLSARTCLAIKQLPQKQRVQCLAAILSLDSFWSLLPDDEFKKWERDLRYNSLVSITGTINDTLGDGYTLRAMLYPETRNGIVGELKKVSTVSGK